MKKDQGKEPVTEHRNGYRNPNSPRLTSFDSNEEIEREVKKKPKASKKKKIESEVENKKKKKPGKGGTDNRTN
ncbi:MAG: hypothetical protein ABI723_01305 [Bacteroidia bacterium]